MLPMWNDQQIKSAERWLKIFEMCSAQENFIENLAMLVEIGFALPGTSTEAERLFSIINNIWTTEKGQMQLPTLEAMLDIRFNCEMSCNEFYKANKCNKELLLKVIGKEKYPQSNSQSS